VILSLTLVLLLGEARAEDGEPPPAETSETGEADGEEADVLSRHRAPFDVLVEQAIGTTSVPVEYNWRRTKVQVAATGNHYFELNNFNSLRAGGMVRLPSDSMLFEVHVSRVWVWDTPSSELLAYTPYRQPGRPSRMEIDITVGVPLAEGVVTVFPRWFPAVQMVLNAYGGLRYLLYPVGFSGMQVRDIGSAILTPTLNEVERANIDETRLDAMQIDPARYGLMAGMGNDLYFRQGVFLSPRAMFALPILAPATETDLLFWADFSLAVGVAF
jgi:hypothetical protein